MAGSVEWLLLAYRMTREPSTPRITVWRKLSRLGVLKLGDGLVALPADARSQERLEWIADEVIEAAGEATLWKAGWPRPPRNEYWRSGWPRRSPGNTGGSSLPPPRPA